MNRTLISLYLSFFTISIFGLETQKGQVYDLKTNQLIYTIEIESIGNDHTNFIYYSSSRKKLGLKKFDFSSGCIGAPAVKMINLQYPQSAELHWSGQNIHVRNVSEGKTSNTEFKNACNMVWDLGIHRFFRSKWEELKEKPLEFTLLAFADEKALEFSAKMDSSYKVYLKPKNAIVKMFVGEIWFQYDENKNLLSYRGASDMKNAEGKSPEVIVKYGPKKVH